jgi:hypothetical protein
MATTPHLTLQRRIAFIQAGYFGVTGIWPLVHMRSFEWVSGRKTDRWLVKTVGALITVIGATIGLAARRNRVTPEIVVLGAGSALALASIDVVYVARRRIRWVYLLDAIAELGLIVGWVLASGTLTLVRSDNGRVGPSSADGPT